MLEEVVNPKRKVYLEAVLLSKKGKKNKTSVSLYTGQLRFTTIPRRESGQKVMTLTWGKRVGINH